MECFCTIFPAIFQKWNFLCIITEYYSSNIHKDKFLKHYEYNICLFNKRAMLPKLLCFSPNNY